MYLVKEFNSILVSLYTSIVRMMSNNIFKQNLYILVLLRGTGSRVFKYKESL